MSNKKLNNDTLRVIKIGKEAIFEFLNETFIDKIKEYCDVNVEDVVSLSDIDFDKGEFTFCVCKDEKLNEINLQKIAQKIPTTTKTMFTKQRYKDYKIKEIANIIKN